MSKNYTAFNRREIYIDNLKVQFKSAKKAERLHFKYWSLEENMLNKYIK